MRTALFILAIVATFIFILNCGGDDVVKIDEDVTVALYPDTAVTAFYSDTVTFSANVWNTTNTAVRWYVNNIENGNETIGTIDTTGEYIAPGAAPDFDEVVIKAVSVADSTKYDTSFVYVLDRSFIFVNADSGDDVNGKGSQVNPYKTITKGLSKALDGQIVIPATGTYNVALGEIFPLTPTQDVTVQGLGASLTIVEPPDDQPAFRLEYNRSAVKNLGITRGTKTGVGIEYAAPDGIDKLQVADVKIENCRAAALNTGQADTIQFIRSDVSNCVYGIIIVEPGFYLALDQSTFTNIDSIAVELISPVTSLIDFDYVVIDSALIGLNLAQGSFALVRESVFSNIESTAVYLNSNANLGISSSVQGLNDFSGCSNLCIINNTADTISALYNTWPSADSATIDNQYIYDNTQDASKGPVIFMPLH